MAFALHDHVHVATDFLVEVIRRPHHTHDLACFWIDANKGGIIKVVARAIFLHPFAHELLRFFLFIPIEAGDHFETSLLNKLHTPLLGKLISKELADVERKMRSANVAQTLRLKLGERVCIDGFASFFLGDKALFGHFFENKGLARDKLIAVIATHARSIGRQPIWSLWNRCKKRGFIQGEITRRLSKVGLCGRFSSVEGGPIRHLVQVHLQNLILGERALNLKGENHLLELAEVVAFVADDGVTDELLREG